MEKQVEVRKRFTTGSGDLGSVLIDWAGKLKAMGHILSCLAWHEKKPGSGTEALCLQGEELGGIISDYAEFIETATEDNLARIHGLEGNAVKQLARCQEVYDFVKNTNRPEDICAIDYRIREMTDFINNISLPAIDLKNSFEDLKKSIIAEQEKGSKSQAAETVQEGMG